MKIAMILLAAGNSRRFRRAGTEEDRPLCCRNTKKEDSENKLLYELNGRPMYRYAFDCLRSFGEDMLTVVTQYDEIAAVSEESGAKVVRNLHPEEGISLSLKLGLQKNIDADACLFSVADQPWISRKSVERLIKIFGDEKKGIACISYQGKLGNPCIFSKKYYKELMMLDGDVGGKKVIKQHMEDVAFCYVENEIELTDIDVRPEE